MNKQTVRFPAEWEPQDGVLIAWPHAQTDWSPWLADVEQTYVALAHAVLRFEPLLIVVRDAALQERVNNLLGRSSAHAVQFIQYDYNDTWLRDSGPVTLYDRGHARWLDFAFTGWGGKYAADADDQLVSALLSDPRFAHIQRQREEFALEGGAIETDGAGTLLSTWNCLEHRHPGRNRDELTAALGAMLACPRVLMLEHGELDGDDTDAHIDTLARFADHQTIVYQGCADPADPHYPSLQRMAAEIRALRKSDGHAYRVLELPWAGELRAVDGRRLAASYANFLIVNDAVLLPGYGLPSDALAAAVLAQAFAGREIVLVPCRSLIEQNGSLHCITMQLPRGVLHLIK
jgi:agmatine/peptidylarginine deiminase